MMVMRAADMANMQSEKALRAAGALARRDDDVGSLKADVALMKWMLGVVMAFEIAIFFKLFLH
jgi:hypothetical protein